MKRYVFIYILLLYTMINARDADRSHELAGKHVLVTGGAGFIGSHLVEQLLSYGAAVTVLDNCSTGCYDHMQSFIDRITFIAGDIRDFTTCMQAMHTIDIVFHLAAFISVPESMQRPLVCHDINVNGTVNILEAARQSGVKRIVFSSSAAVYGAKEGVCREDDMLHPESPYGYSKLIGEYYCQQYAQLYDMQIVCLRYFNVYGARQNPAGPYAAARAKFADAMHHDHDITIFGDGAQTRDFVPVNLVVKANVCAAYKPVESMSVYNVATGRSVSLLTVIEQLWHEFPSYVGTIYFQPSRPGDVKHSAAHTEKLEKNLFS